MPSTNHDRRMRWTNGPNDAIKYLEAHGYQQTKDWRWFKHGTDRETPKEIDAILYLIEEWDWGGLLNSFLEEQYLHWPDDDPRWSMEEWPR